MKGLTNAQGGGGAALDYNVTFKVEGEDYYIASCLDGDSIAAPPKPAVSGKVFRGWYIGTDRITFPYTPTSSVEMVADMLSSVIVGFTGMTNENSVLTWTDDLANLNDSPAYTTTASGSYVTVDSAVKDIFPFSEIEEMTDTAGNVFVKYPKMWQKWIYDANGNLDGVKFCNVQADDDFFVSDAYLKSDDLAVYNDYFALGKYEGSGSSAQMYSKSGQTCLVGVTRAQCRTAAKANGETYQQLDFSQFILYNMLTMLKYRTSNIQSVYAGATNNTEAKPTGSCDLVNGLDGWNTLNGCVKMNGIENPYGNIYKWVDGIWFSDTVVYAHRLPSQFADSSTNAVNIEVPRATSGSYTKYLKTGSQSSQRSYAYCTNASGSSSTYFADVYYYYSSGTVLNGGGRWNNTADAGLWCLRGDGTASVSSAGVGSRLSYRPS